MRVLQVGKFYPPHKGGIETVIESISESLAAYADVEVLVANDRPRTVRERVGDIPVTRAASFGSMAATSLCPTFSGWMRSLCGDINHLHESNPLATIAYLTARPRGKLIVSFHSEIVRQRRLMKGYEPFRRRLLQRAARILVATPDHFLHSPSLAPFREKCAVVPFGIDVDRFSEAPNLSIRAEQLRRRFEPPIVLFVGRLVYYKGVDVLIRSMEGVPATLLIAGDGPMRLRWRRMAREGPSGDRIHFLGEVATEELPSLYHASDVLVLPSINSSEAFGVVQLEAMAAGKPVISTRLNSGVAWVNQHERTGLIVEPGDAEELARAIRHLVEHPELRRSMGSAGLNRVRSEFDRRLMGARLMSIYREVTD